MHVRNDENIYSVCNCVMSNNHYLGKICKKNMAILCNGSGFFNGLTPRPGGVHLYYVWVWVQL